MTLIAEIQSRRWDIVTAPPDLHLCFAELLGGLGLVQALQGAIVAFVELPGICDGDPLEVQFLQNSPERLNCTLKNRSVSNIKNIAALSQQFSRLMCLFPAQLSQTDVGPARETVFEIPGALA